MEIVEGWTGNVDAQLKADGLAVDLTGMTLALILRDEDGTVVTTTGVTVSSSTSGKVTYAPGSSNDLKSSKSPYSAHWKVVDGTGKIVFFPSGKADVWVVHSQ